MPPSEEHRTDLEKKLPLQVDDIEAFEKNSKAGASVNAVDYSGAIAKTDPAEIALVRKLDYRIMPALFCMYFLNRLDQNAIANARLNGLEKDLGLRGSQYNTCISILYVGYLFAQIPSNMLMSSKKVRPSLTGQKLRNIFAVSFAGLIAAATFATLDDKHGMHGWQWLFIIEGVVTIGVAIVCIFLLPDEPLTTKWLTPEQRRLAHARIQRDTVGLEHTKGFFPTVVSSLGFSTTITLVLTAPPSLVAGVVGICVGISSGKFNDHTWHITVMMGIAMIGFMISALTLNLPARYISCFLFASGVYSVNSVILGWVSGTLGQTPEKKAVSLSIVNVVSMASFIYTPYLYPKSDGPKYVMAMSSNASFAFASIAAAWLLRIWLITQNKRLKRSGSDVFYAY
ncbi:hypothetical protein EKO04_003975 [Ascochyta lentis]|uniref:Major facilitator superfamily transporter n=1 Tax=Ascochyta lentis TaxID=205686 RepID=A0A8H7J7G5_9PLEO|nr:hypothetical protein EKO04_003975 [Ascochyta lentis]